MSTSAEQQRPITDGGSDLSEPRWAVVSFEGLEASGLSYDGARRRLADLDEQKIAGLCIITDEAAERVGRS